MNTLFVALISIVLSVIAQFSLKVGMSSENVQEILTKPNSFGTLVTVLTEKYVFLGFLLYGLGAIIWLGVLSKWDVSKAYPLVGLGFIFTVIIGFLVGEQVTISRVIGVVLICAGVFLVGQS